MKEFKLQSSIKLVLFVFGLVIVLIVLWINSTNIANLREGNRQQLEKVANKYGVELETVELPGKTGPKDFPSQGERLVQAMRCKWRGDVEDGQRCVERAERGG